MSQLKQTTLPFKGLRRSSLLTTGNVLNPDGLEHGHSQPGTGVIFRLNEDPFAVCTVQNSQNTQMPIVLAESLPDQSTNDPREVNRLGLCNSDARIRPEEEIQVEHEKLDDGDVSHEYLERLAAFEDGQNRICNVMRFMIRAGRTNEEFLKELNKDFNQQSAQVQTTQEAFLKFHQDTHSWAGFVNATLEFNQAHFTERIGTLSKEVMRVNNFVESLYSGVKEKMEEFELRLGALEARQASQPTGDHVTLTSSELEVRVGRMEKELGFLGKEVSFLLSSLPKDHIPPVLQHVGSRKEEGHIVQATKAPENKDEIHLADSKASSGLVRDLSMIGDLSLTRLREIRNMINKRIKKAARTERATGREQNSGNGTTEAKKDQLEQPKRENPSANAVPSRNKPCRFFAKGKCAYGTKCKFSHAVQPSTKGQNNQGNQINKNKPGTRDGQRDSRIQASQSGHGTKKPTPASNAEGRRRQGQPGHRDRQEEEDNLHAALTRGFKDLRRQVAESLVRPTRDEPLEGNFRHSCCRHHHSC
jgi:hypothetical protein